MLYLKIKRKNMWVIRRAQYGFSDVRIKFWRQPPGSASSLRPSLGEDGSDSLAQREACDSVPALPVGGGRPSCQKSHVRDGCCTSNSVSCCGFALCGCSFKLKFLWGENTEGWATSVHLLKGGLPAFASETGGQRERVLSQVTTQLFSRLSSSRWELTWRALKLQPWRLERLLHSFPCFQKSTRPYNHTNSSC